MSAAIIHMDGCHFFVWVREDGLLTFDERTGSDLAVHSNAKECERCRELLSGAEPRHLTANVEVVDDGKEMFWRTVIAVAELDEGEVAISV